MASAPEATHSNMAGALRLAAGLILQGTAGRLVLMSDDNENIGSAGDEALQTQANRIPPDVLLLKSRALADTFMWEVSMPSEARSGETVPVWGSVEATAPQETMAMIMVDGAPIARQKVTLGAGTTSPEAPVALDEPGFHRVDVLLEGCGEQSRENDRGSAFVRVGGQPRVLVIDRDPGGEQTLRRSLALQGITVEVGGPAKPPTSPADLERYDSVWLSNLPAYSMDPRQMTMLRDITRDLASAWGGSAASTHSVREGTIRHRSRRRRR